MQTNENCIPADIQEWLLNSTSEKEADRWSHHIEQCPHCRSRIDEQPTSLAWPKILSEDAWDHDLSSSQEVSRKPTLSNAIDQASLEKFARQVIDKSDNPAMLGRLGEFEILEPIGMGGMSLVLKGYDHELNRFVAIKVLAPHLALVGVARQRFAREAQAAASIVDPHVVPIHSVAADHDPPYLVMTYVPGQTLQATIDSEGSLDVLVAVRIAYQVAMGLAAAHAQGLVHRDIKPSNILLERNVQRAYIADFGLARAADDASLTRSGFLAGTPDYMSPEQARGESIDARSDLFSLGSVLYTMLTGHPPFRAASPMAVLNRISQDTPRSILECNPRVPPWLSRFAERLLSKLPDDRFASAAETAKTLEAALRHLQDPIACPLPVELAEQTVTPKQDTPTRVSQRPMALGIFVLCLLGGWVVATVWWPGTAEERIHLQPSSSVAGAMELTATQQISSAVQSDVELFRQFDSLDLEIESMSQELKQAIADSYEASLPETSEGNQEDASKSIERDLLDGIKEIETQIDQWLLEFNSEGKS